MVERALALALVALLSLVAPAGAEEGTTAGQPIVLGAERSSAVGRLAGNRGGAYAFYAFDYPGSGQLVVVRLRVSQSYGEVGRLLGFNVYGPQGHLGSGRPKDGDPTATQAELTFAESAPGRYLVQVCNYVDGASVDFPLDVEGLGAAPPPPPSTRPEEAPLANRSLPHLAGTLVGQSGGAFHYVAVDYPGGDEQLTVTLTVGPRYAPSERALGMHLYRGSDLVATGQVAEVADERQTFVLYYRGRSAERLTLQVFNYAPGHAASYAISVSGAAPQFVEAEANTAPERALVLSDQQRGYSGQLVGSHVGASHFYLLHHPGGQRSVRLVATFTSPTPLPATAVGMHVWRGADPVGKWVAEPTQQGVWSATATLNPSDPTTYGVQLSNYADGQAVEYRIVVLGLGD
jgi:hypothetical protein